jgi:trans-2,3-dihydro-3-hydroxyanthranilate isomerase
VKLRFRIADVFTDRPLAGNQLAVVLGADDLEPGLMQAIAREFNFSETTFVSRSEVAGCDWLVRIFTPTHEMPMAGHPTVGTAVVLHGEGLVGERAVFELGVGPTPVEVRPGGVAWMTQQEAWFGLEQPDRAQLAAALGLLPDEIRSDLPAQVVSTGNPFLLVPIASVAALSRISPRFEEWSVVQSVSERGEAYCFVAGDPIRARMFVPETPFEDPATGSAAGPLGAYAARHLGRTSLVVQQGVELGRPSVIEVDASEARPRVGGRAVVVASGELDLP